MRQGRGAASKLPGRRTLEQIAGPWTTYILWLLRNEGVLRFNALRAHMPGISPKVLTERLKRLEADGLIHRDYRPTIPPQVSYSLTRRGDELKDILDALGAVAQRWAARIWRRLAMLRISVTARCIDGDRVSRRHLRMAGLIQAI